MVCGSRSLLCLERLLGGCHVASRPRHAADVALIDVDIEITLREVEPRLLNEAIETISNLLVPSTTRGQARIHVDVEPATTHFDVEIARAA
jgi:hypothetical protein